MASLFHCFFNNEAMKRDETMKYNETIYLISKELFYALTGALVIFVVLEIIRPGVVLAYININWVLIFWLAIGIVILTTKNNSA